MKSISRPLNVVNSHLDRSAQKDPLLQQNYSHEERSPTPDQSTPVSISEAASFLKEHAHLAYDDATSSLFWSLAKEHANKVYNSKAGEHYIFSDGSCMSSDFMGGITTAPIAPLDLKSYRALKREQGSVQYVEDISLAGRLKATVGRFLR